MQYGVTQTSWNQTEILPVRVFLTHNQKSPPASSWEALRAGLKLTVKEYDYEYDYEFLNPRPMNP